MEINNYFTLVLILATTIIGGCVFLLFYTKSVQKTNNKPAKTVKHEKHQEKKSKEPPTKSKKKLTDRWSNKHDKQQFTNPWLLNNLKGHTGEILDMDYSSNGKFLATCADDRTVLLWDIKDLTQKEHRSIRINIEFDYTKFVKWSPDSKAFLIHRYNENCIEVYKIEKRKDGLLGQATKALTYPKCHSEDVIGMDIANNGKFLMTCSNKTDLIVWDLKGQKLAQIDTYLMNTICAKISPCSRFIVASGFAPDVKVWEVVFNKNGDFQEVKRVFELTGHKSGVYDVAFDVDSSHMATVSKDGTWKLYDTKIDYKRGEDPHMKITNTYQHNDGAKIALSPNSYVIVIGTANLLQFYSTIDGNLDNVIHNIYTGNITSILFDSFGKYLLTTGDKQVRIFHNVTGYRCSIKDAKNKLREQQTSATKERLQQLIKDCEYFLKTIE